jgi:hypothetical protein
LPQGLAHLLIPRFGKQVNVQLKETVLEHSSDRRPSFSRCVVSKRFAFVSSQHHLQHP